MGATRQIPNTRRRSVTDWRVAQSQFSDHPADLFSGDLRPKAASGTVRPVLAGQNVARMTRENEGYPSSPGHAFPVENTGT